MEKEELLKWIKIADDILKKNQNVYNCPNHSEHFISFELKFFPEFTRRELILSCKSCDKQHIVSADLN